MIRIMLVTCSFCCSTANGFPAPTPKEPPTHAELIVGVWVVEAEKCTTYEFTADGTLLVATVGQDIIMKRYRISVDSTGKEVILVSRIPSGSRQHPPEFVAFLADDSPVTSTHLGNQANAGEWFNAWQVSECHFFDFLISELLECSPKLLAYIGFIPINADQRAIG